MSKRGVGSVSEQKAMIAALDAASRQRRLSPTESGLLADLLRLEDLRERWRKRRRSEQLRRALARLAQLADDFRSAA